MSKTACSLFILLAIWGCGGSGLDGEYIGRIGDKKEVSMIFADGGDVELRGYWTQPLKGSYEQASLRGESVDSVVFWGPEDKKFKLRIMYVIESENLRILGIHSRAIGPGSRYISTEPDSSFSSNRPIMKKIQADG
tara:strand:- start:111 stop:518 length:408 start_codon:yes stop_codon:yes gene_type:complete